MELIIAPDARAQVVFLEPRGFFRAIGESVSKALATLWAYFHIISPEF
jgi:hypothetical protein